MEETGFSLSVGDFSGKAASKVKTRYIKPPRNRELPERRMKYRNAEALAREIKAERNARYFVIIDGSFIAGDFIEAFIIEQKLRVERLTISTLSLSENNVDSLSGLLKFGYVKELNLIVSDYFYSHERKNLIPYIYQECDLENRFQLAAAGTHCKTTLIETTSGLFFTMHGSANLRSSNNIEHICIEEGRELYDFNFEYMSAIIEKYHTIRKPIRHDTLWQAVAK